MKFVLVGDDFPAVQTLDLLLNAQGADVTAVFTNTDAPSAGMLVRQAQAKSIPVYPANRLRDPEMVEKLIKLRFDWLINVNSTVILPGDVIRSASAGAFNMHPGLLPEYAGLHTHQWAILNGETTFGATIHEITERVDTGKIVRRAEVPINDDDTGLSLFMKCIRAGTDALGEVLERILAGKAVQSYPQDLSKRRLYRIKDLPSGRIDWSMDAEYIERLVRAGNYEPLRSPSFIAHFKAPDGSELQLLECSVANTGPKGQPGDEWQPGTVVQSSASKRPMTICGDGKWVTLDKVRHPEPNSTPVPESELLRLIPHNSRLP